MQVSETKYLFSWYYLRILMTIHDTVSRKAFTKSIVAQLSYVWLCDVITTRYYHSSSALFQISSAILFICLTKVKVKDTVECAKRKWLWHLYFKAHLYFAIQSTCFPHSCFPGVDLYKLLHFCSFFNHTVLLMLWPTWFWASGGSCL